MGQQLTSNCNILKRRELQTFWTKCTQVLSVIPLRASPEGLPAEGQAAYSPVNAKERKCQVSGLQKQGCLGNSPLYTACSLSGFAKISKCAGKPDLGQGSTAGSLAPQECISQTGEQNDTSAPQTAQVFAEYLDKPGRRISLTLR